MNMMQAQTQQIDPALSALLQTAQMVTPDQTPTVAAQVAQAAQQKMQPRQSASPGIAALMPGVQQQAMNVAQASQPVTQAQVQQMMQQSQPQQQPAMQQPGVANLPAPNMQRMRQMAMGGVVGYAEGGTPLTYGYSPDYEDARRLGIDLSPYDSPEVRKQKLDRLQKMREFEKQRKLFGEIPTEASVSRDAALQAAYPGRGRDQDLIRQVQPGRTAAPPMAASPEGQRLAQAQSMPTQFNVGVGAIPALRRAAPQVAPQGGIAALPAAPTFGAAMKEAEQALPGTGTEQNRAELQRLQEMRRVRPDTGQMTSKALEEEGGVAAALKSKLDQSAQERGIMSWLMGGEGRGASARSYESFRKAEDQRQMLHAQENTIRIAKIEAIKEANEARKIGDQESYVNALNKISELERADKQVKATLAANIFQTQSSIRGQDITAQTSASDRAAQAALRNLPSFEQQMAKRVMDDFMAKNPGATLSDAYDFYRGAGKGLDERAKALRERNEIARRKLLESDMMYAATRMAYVNEKDPAKKAEAMRKMKEIERMNGIVDEGEEAPSKTQAPPPVGTVMQGYRFKGGNPADRNNWEKV